MHIILFFKNILITLFVVSICGQFIYAVEIDFNRQIRPILSENCFQCHGPDQSHRKANYRLDTKEGVFAVGKSGKKNILLRDAKNSELVHRIEEAEGDGLMPPLKSGKKLNADQIKLIKQWINEGANYGEHWAFVVPKSNSVPDVNNSKWVRTPIDAFVLSRLESNNITPSPQASKEVLIRRLTLDLIGLPPTLKEVDDFLRDDSPQAYEKVVDRLLASNQYGERMAMQWLDYARFADSNGFQTDSSRSMWPWRDWVINAYNANMPFNQFTIEQIAGDMLPNATKSQIIATGFNRNHRLNGEGGLIAEEWRIENVIDRVDTTSQTWLGLTLACARCHDHKYDPISQKEFYQFFAFFNNLPESGTLAGNQTGGNTEPVEEIESPSQNAESLKIQLAIKEQEALILKLDEKVDPMIKEWEPVFKEKVNSAGNVWTPLNPTTVKSEGGAKFSKLTDGSYLASGKNPTNDVYTITSNVSKGFFSAILLECFPDPSLPNQSLGRFSNGNFVLSKIEAELSSPSLKTPLKIAFNKAIADYSQKGWDIINVVGNDSSKGWAVDGPTRRDITKAMFVSPQLVDIPENSTIKISLSHQALSQHNIGRFRIAISSVPGELITLKGFQVPVNITKIIETDPQKRSLQQKEELRKYYKATSFKEHKVASDKLVLLKNNLVDSKKNIPGVMVMKEGPVRDTFMLIRGEYDKKGPKVVAGLPSVLPPLPKDKPMNRLGLAYWMVDPSNPLTSRVWVNRMWEKFFGYGLVRTSENFGAQSEFPSHPELLDWLASKFVSLNWDMKAMQKIVVMSSVYQQSSNLNPSLLNNDPENRMLARGSRLRLSGETLRDQALFASGLMVNKTGGPSVRPYMPEGVWDETSRYGDLRNYKNDKGEALYRRTMYTIWKRTAAPPTMLLFDAPNREACSVKRSRTNTPLQALALLNEVTYVEAARKLAEKIIREGGNTPDDKLTTGFRIVTGRRPDSSELAILVKGFHKDYENFKSKPENAKRFTSLGESPLANTADISELAAYTLSANILLNLDEVVNRE
jgi:hypothetical protein